MKRFEPIRPIFLFITIVFILSNGHAAKRQELTDGEKIFVVIIPKNTVLFDIKNKKDLKTHKKIHAKAFSSSPENPFFTIVDQKNQPRFLVNSKNIFNLDKLANFDESPKFFKPTFKKMKRDSFDKDISLNNDFFFEINYFTLSFYDSKNNSLLKTSKNYSSILYDLTLKSKLPIFFGINTSLSREGNQKESMISKIDLGFTLKTKDFSYSILENIQLSFYGLKTLFQNTIIQGEKVELSTSSFRVKLSKKITLIKKYNFKLGIGGSHHQSFFKKNSDSLFFDQSSYFSYDIFIGIQNKSIL